MREATARPDKVTRIYLGCSAAFVGLFLLVGIAVVIMVLVNGSGDNLPALGIGLAFVIIPAGALLLIRWVWREAALREERRLRAPDQPWAWKQDVSTGVMKGTSPTATIVVWVLFAGFWLGMMTLVTALGWEKIRSETYVSIFIAVFWLAGLFLAGMAVNAILHARRFGASTLALDATPARLGGWLSGVVRAPLAVQGADVQLTVTCVRTTHSRSGSSSSTSTWNLWRTTKMLDGQRLERHADGVAIPFAVRLPTDAEATREPEGNVMVSVLGSSAVGLRGADIDWYVGVKAALPGVDYQDRFAVPVAAPEAGAVPVPGYAPRDMPELAGDRLASRLPGRLEHEADADVFVFPLKPSWVVWAVGLAAVAVGGPLLHDAPQLAQVPWDVVKWVAIVCGVLAALSFVGLLLDTRRIEVAPGAVRIRRGILGLGFHRTVPREAIASVDEETSRSDPPSYSVNIRLHDGTSYWAALAISEPDRAAALAARLRQILQLRS